MKYKIAVIEDDQSVQKMLVDSLKRAGYLVESSGDGKDAVNLIFQEKPDLVVLDWNLPGLSGIQISQSMRASSATSHIPILMITVFNDIRNKVAAFETGVDDYLTKPFNMQEFSARIKALLQRGSFGQSKEILRCRGIQINVTTHTVEVDGRKIDLRRKEFDLLLIFLRFKGHLLKREYLKERVWGYDSDILTRTVDSHVARIREKLGPKGSKLIKTVPGFGYRFESDSD